MRLNSSILAIGLTLVSSVLSRAQEEATDLLNRPGADLSNPAFRADVVARMRVIGENRRKATHDKALRMGLPIRNVRANGRVEEIMDFHPDGRPIYLTTHNANAAISTGANQLWPSPYSLTGSGITVGVWDGGSVLSNHQELTGRVILGNPSIAAIDHATHVAGTIAASGITSSARGMASAAQIESYDWTSDTTEMISRASAAATDGKLKLSNHSYGNISGWAYVDGGIPYRLWQWYGPGTTNTAVETDFGVYNSTASGQDSIAYNAPYYLIFRSAGNDRGENPATGSSVYIGTSVVTYDSAIHPPGDAVYQAGFETIANAALGKNVITIGSATDAVSSGVRNPAVSGVSSFSSWGPTDDGRIKPDVVANGDGLYSSLSTSTTAYAYYSGTSMASPNACGSAALLIQQYGQLFPNQAMRSSTLKSLLIHTADDLGNPGPDYKTGWGLVNAKAAADLIQDHASHPDKKRMAENQLTTTTTSQNVIFVWDGVSPIRATLCWTDPAGASTTTSDSRTSRLRNNLDLKIIAPGGNEYLPYVMPFVGTWTQASMNSAATTGTNNTDNVEQVRIATPPAAGVYQAVVSCSGTLYNNAAQTYSLILSGASDQLPPPPSPPTNLVATPGNNSVSLAWNMSAGATTYNIKRATTSGGPYSDIGSTASTGFLDTSVTNGSTYFYIVSASSTYGESAASAETSVIPAPSPSTTVVTSSPGASGAYGSSVTLTATVSGTSGTPTGTVTFRDGATTIGTGTLNASGQATATISNLTLGAHSITAGYSGDHVFGPGTSAAFAYTVTPKPVTITGVTAANKVYDATTTATPGGGTVSGVLSGETVTVVPGTVVFDSPNTGLQSLTASGYGITGTHSANYQLAAQPTVANAVISPRPLQITGSRVYDGTTLVSASDLTILNNLDGTNLALTGSIATTGKNVGTQTIATGATRVQSSKGNTGTNQVTSFTVTMGSTPVSGNTLVAVISTRGTTASRVSSISQTGATWTRAAQAANSNGTTTEIWYAPGVSNASTIITINQANLRSAAVVVEYSGLLTAASLDQTGNSTGNSTSPVTGTTPATTQADELWIGGIGYISSTPTLGSITNGFVTVANEQSTNNTASRNARLYVLEKKPTSIGTASSGGTLSTTAQWSGAIATFKSASIGTLATTGTAGGNYTLAGATGSIQITPKSLNVTGIAAADRPYDGTTNAILTGTPSLPPAQSPGAGTSADGAPYTGDDLVLGGTVTGTFADKHAGTSKPVAISAFTLGGTQAGNYTLIQPSGFTATISPRLTTVAAVFSTKVYDGTTASSGTPSITPSLAPGDTTTHLSQVYQNADAGIGNKVIVPSIAINDGNAGANYSVNLVNHTTGTITPAPVNVTLGSLAHVYDGTAKSASAVTEPAGFEVNLTYNGSSEAPVNAGSYTVTATITDPNHAGTATATLIIDKAEASVVLTNLTRTYDGTPRSITVNATPGDLGIEISYEGSSDAPIDAGTYAVSATADGPNHHGTASGTLVIEKAAATIELEDLSQTYDGSPKSVTTMTTPGDLTISTTYDGSPDAPTSAGSYAVIVTADGPNHHGTASGTLVIGKAAATIELADLSQTYDGSPKPVTAIVTPGGLTVTTTYDGSVAVPTEVGSYAVLVTADGPNHHGTASGTLVIEPGNAAMAWTTGYFSESEIIQGLAADEADPDGDGLVNLAEYALGTDPRHFSPPLAAVRDENGLTLDFTRPAGLPGISYAAESSDGLGTWSPVTLEVIETGTTETVRARDPLTSGNPGRRFIRLRFERQ